MINWNQKVFGIWFSSQFSFSFSFIKFSFSIKRKIVVFPVGYCILAYCRDEKQSDHKMQNSQINTQRMIEEDMMVVFLCCLEFPWKAWTKWMYFDQYLFVHNMFRSEKWFFKWKHEGKMTVEKEVLCSIK